ncbi:hypothetical protein KVK32_01010 [Helicobacter pylori]|nr:hypothetical protein KVK32_01010 [Helicobacter pylori]
MPLDAQRADALEIKICKIPIIGIQSETQTLRISLGKISNIFSVAPILTSLFSINIL